MDVTITTVIIIVIVIVIIYGYLIYNNIYICGYLTVNLELKLIRCLIFGGWDYLVVIVAHKGQNEVVRK